MHHPVLEVRDVVVRFGAITALDHVSFTVAPQEIRGLIGPNGSGKTTLFNAISNIVRRTSGNILLRGQSLAAVPRHRLARAGIGRTFQNVALFPTLSALDNVLLGAHARLRASFAAGALGLGARAEANARAQAHVWLDAVGLADAAATPVDALPFPLQKRVELARAMMTEPALLLLDEPAAGLNHEEVMRLAGLIRALRDKHGVAVLLVEHHMNLVMAVSDRVVALEFGRVIADGSPATVQNDPSVIRAYLGEPA